MLARGRPVLRTWVGCQHARDASGSLSSPLSADTEVADLWGVRLQHTHTVKQKHN